MRISDWSSDVCSSDRVAALVAAEAELGPLFALVERAADGGLTLNELAALFWHCIVDRPEALTREAVGEAVVAAGLAAVPPALRGLLGQILQGRSGGGRWISSPSPPGERSGVDSRRLPQCRWPPPQPPPPTLRRT